MVFSSLDIVKTTLISKGTAKGTIEIPKGRSKGQSRLFEGTERKRDKLAKMCVEQKKGKLEKTR